MSCTLQSSGQTERTERGDKEMLYRKDRYGNEISQLGFGCMRFTRKGNKIDHEKAEKEILAAFKQGVNYYDTAYLYPGSEDCLGRILEKNNCRDNARRNRYENFKCVFIRFQNYNTLICLLKFIQSVFFLSFCFF